MVMYHSTVGHMRPLTHAYTWMKNGIRTDGASIFKNNTLLFFHA
jgi:hypothetical protein